MPTTTKKQRGRPRKADGEKRRNNVTIRMKDDIKRRIQEAADAQGRSLSEEIEFSLERRFLEEAAYGGKELNGLLKLMVWAAEIIQARTGKLWSSDWETSVAVRAAWTKLGAAAGPKHPAEYIQLDKRVGEMAQQPEPPTRPSPPELTNYMLLLRPDLSEDVKAYAAEMAAFEKAQKRYDRLRAKYESQLKELHKDAQVLTDAFTSYQDLGKDVADELLPRREAVIQTAIPAQRVEKPKEK